MCCCGPTGLCVMRKTEYYGTADTSPVLGSSSLELLRRRGLWHVSKKAFYQYPFRLLYPLFKPREFRYDNSSLPYFNHTYNNAYFNERTIEVAVALDILRSHADQNVLEVGNVLSHYVPTATWDVVDKYEFGTGVINADIVDFRPEKTYDLIISISTLEHIGYDEQPQDDMKINLTLSHLIGLLKVRGTMIITFPLGWNPILDDKFTAGELPFTKMHVFERNSWKNTWVEADIPLIPPFSYGKFLGADYLVVGIYQK